MRQRRPVIAGLAIGGVAALAILLVGGQVVRPPTGPTPSVKASEPTVGGNGPVVFYEIDDGDGAKLMVRTLDGRSLARVVASRMDIDMPRTWSVDPTGATAIAATRRPGGDGTRLEGVTVGTGAAIWAVEVPSAGVFEGVWSTDGRRFATTTAPDDPASREVLVVDATNGAVARTTIPESAALQGFDPNGALVLRQRWPTVDGGNVGWQFLRIDPPTGEIERLAGLPDVGPASGWSEDVDPAIGTGFDTAVAPDDESKTALRAWSLAARTNRVVGTFPTIDRLAMDPSGLAVAVSVQQSILVVGRDGRATEAWRGTDPASTFDWSTRGDFLAVATGDTDPALFVVERSSGRVVELPLPAAIASAAIVRILDSSALGELALPAVEPTPTPTPGPSGADVPGSDGILVAWIASASGSAILHVERRVPTAEGGLRIAAAMGTADLGPGALADDGGPGIDLLPRPGSHDVLVRVQGADRTLTWLWDGTGARPEIPLPADWPATTYDFAWRPDGQAVAASATLLSRNGEPEDVVVVATLGARKTTVVHLPVGRDYDRLESWWSPTELKIGHAICTEGCPGRYAWSARYGIRTHRLHELTAADRSRGQVDIIVPADPSGFDMTTGNDMARSTIHVGWPAALGGTGPNVIGFAADDRSVIVSTEPAEGTDIYRIDDPAGRAVAGRLADPEPILIGHLARRGLDIRVSPDERWALVRDRTDTTELIELATGRIWPIDRGATTGWASGG
jgi:hypothetical protein